MMILILLATVSFVLESEAMVETGILYDTGASVRLRLPAHPLQCAASAPALIRSNAQVWLRHRVRA